MWLGSAEDRSSKGEILQSSKSHWIGNDILTSTEELRGAPRPRKDDAGEERLKASCACGGVRFYITRPNEESQKASSPYSDLIIPFHTGASSANPENEPWWLRDNNTKYMAGTCMCRSCRVASGFEIQTWAFVPKCNVFQDDGRPVDYNMGTMKTYPSTEDVWREFCAVCGATVFWRCGWRPTVVDISIGLFNPEEGARVEAWLDWWTERVSFEEMAINRTLVRRLEEGLRKWGRDRASQ